MTGNPISGWIKSRLDFIRLQWQLTAAMDTLQKSELKVLLDRARIQKEVALATLRKKKEEQR